jgi:hypothetical protein
MKQLNGTWYQARLSMPRPPTPPEEKDPTLDDAIRYLWTGFTVGLFAGLALQRFAGVL